MSTHQLRATQQRGLDEETDRILDALENIEGELSETDEILEALEDPGDAPEIAFAVRKADICKKVGEDAFELVENLPLDEALERIDEKEYFEADHDYTKILGGTLSAKCVLVKVKNPSTNGDPHFTMFNGHKFDFHGTGITSKGESGIWLYWIAPLT